MYRIVMGILGLAALWLLMSGLFKPLILVFGALSVLLAVFISVKMDQADGEQLNFSIRPLAAVKYLCWLMVEIAKSNWAVTKVILSAKMPINQNLFNVPVTQKSDMGQVIFANSITLTPGTITVETEDNHFLVHALDYSDDDMDALADMDRRVTATETLAGGNKS